MSANSKPIRAAVNSALTKGGRTGAYEHAIGAEEDEAVPPSSPLARKGKGKKRALSPPSKTRPMRAAIICPRATQQFLSAADSTPNTLFYIDYRKTAREAADAVRLARWQAGKLAQGKKDRELVSKRKAIGHETDFHIKKAIEEEKPHLVLIFGNSGFDGRLPGAWNMRRATWGRRGKAEKMRS